MLPIGALLVAPDLLPGLNPRTQATGLPRASPWSDRVDLDVERDQLQDWIIGVGRRYVSEAAGN